MLLPSYSFGLLHEQRAKALRKESISVAQVLCTAPQAYLMLELGWIAPVHRHRSAIDVQLSHNTAPALVAFLLYELGTKRAIFGALAQPQQADEDVSFWVFVRQERFPPPVRRVIASQKLYRLRADFVVYFMYLNGAV